VNLEGRSRYLKHDPLDCVVLESNIEYYYQDYYPQAAATELQQVESVILKQAGFRCAAAPSVPARSPFSPSPS